MHIFELHSETLNTFCFMTSNEYCNYQDGESRLEVVDMMTQQARIIDVSNVELIPRVTFQGLELHGERVV